MPIEFHCGQCQHRLRTPDDLAGQKARCPQCGHIQAIPAAGSMVSGAGEIKPLPDASPFDGSVFATPSLQPDNPFAEADESVDQNPYSTPIGYTKSMPTTIPLDPHATIAPGICLIVCAAIFIAFVAILILAGILSVVDEGLKDDDVLAFVLLSVMLAIQFLILWGGINMVRRRGYTMAMLGVIAAIAPLSGCWCISLPIGVWGLTSLMKGGMRAVFSSNEFR